jgi:hypothetical protein
MVETILQRVEAVMEKVRDEDGRESAAVLERRTQLSFGRRRAEGGERSARVLATFKSPPMETYIL